MLKLCSNAHSQNFLFKVVKLVEDDQLRDELPNEDTDETDEEDYGYWNHTYTTNLPETIEILQELHKFLIEYGDLVGRET